MSLVRELLEEVSRIEAAIEAFAPICGVEDIPDIDAVAAMAGLLLLSPIILLLSGLVRIKLGPPVFFGQLRPEPDIGPRGPTAIGVFLSPQNH